jgi:galactosylceramidase
MFLFLLLLPAVLAVIRINLDSAPGPEFDGVGGLSAGAGTRLLIDYPADIRADVLDYLFKPDFGGAMQVLKIEIGGAGDSTIGTEDTHEQSRGDQNFTRGYETWFLSEALARNPDIIVYALAWTFPAWVTSAVEGFGSAAVTYIVDWVSMRMRAASGGQLKAVCC